MKLTANYFLPCCVAAVLATVCLPAARAQMFVNGNFETNTLPSGGGVGATSSTTINGWTTTVGNGTNANVYVGKNGGAQTWVPSAQSGTFCVQLDGSQSSSDNGFAGDGSVSTPARTTISQTFKAPAGTYTLSFYIATEVGANKGGTSGVLVSLTGVASGALSNVEYTVTNGASGTTVGTLWQQITSTFTVTNPNTAITLTFADDPNTSLANYTGSSDISIDNVTIPEPSTVLGGMAAAGAFALRLIRRRRAV